MREITLGQYYPVSSFVHKLDPRTKLIIALLYLVVIFFVDTFVGFGVILAFLALAIAFSKVPLLKILKSLKVIMFLVFFTVLMTLVFYGGAKDEVLFSWWVIVVYKGQLENCALMALRLIFLVIGPTLLTYTTTPVELTDGIESLLKPLKLVGINVRAFALVMSITLRLIPTLSEETDKIINAQKARCADFESGNIFKRAKAMLPILIPLLCSSFRRADELAYAMDSRCYKGSKDRTRLKKLSFSYKDPIALVIFLLVTFVIFWIKFNFLPFVDLTTLGWIV